MTTTVTELPGYVVGTWDVDPTHSEVSFLVRHLMVSKVRGHFRDFTAEIVTAPDPVDSSVTATIDLNSVDTANEQRDAHLRSSDFFGTDDFPTMTYRSTGIHPDGDGYRLDGELTLKGVTRQVPLRLEVGGFSPDPWGGVRVGFSATGEINRHDFGLNWNTALEGGGVVVGDKVTINLEIEATLRQPAGEPAAS
jgi:polyisoprenoid-binding protein YceI